MLIYGYDFSFPTLPEGYKAEITPVSNKNGIALFHLHFDFGGRILPKPVALTFCIPSVNVASWYTPLIGQMRISRCIHPEWMPSRSHSTLASGIPISSYIGHDEHNAITVSLSDCATSTAIDSNIWQAKAMIRYTVTFFTKNSGYLSAFDDEMRIDTRDIPFAEVLKDTEDYLFDVNRLETAYVPADAECPMYSTWYSYQQQVEAEALIKECEVASKMGMKSIIVDDGWQTDDSNLGYAFCGDWEPTPKRFPDIHDFVRRVHDLGMKVIFWYSVPYVGKNSKAFNRFKDMFLDNPESDWCILDPRYPEVREFLIGKYVQAIRDWHLDGLKLDFIDLFVLTEYSHYDDPRMDYASLDEAVDRLMVDIRKTVTALNPEVLLEFRQWYIGPAMQTYGSMFRVGDCPDDSIQNRVSAIDMRLVMHRVPVHSDMIVWHANDRVDVAARQFLNIFFTVPQISVRFADITAEQKAMLNYLLGVWYQHRDVLLHGSFRPEGVAGVYDYLSVDNDKEAFVFDFAKNLFRYDGKKPTVYVNLTKTDSVMMFSASPATCRIFDCLGNLTETREINGFADIKVPLSGLMFVNC